MSFCPVVLQALLLNEDDRGFCGGTILNEYIILTAAHCMNFSRFIYVKLGRFGVPTNFLFWFCSVSSKKASSSRKIKYSSFLSQGEFDILVDDGNEAIYNVETIITHNKYRPLTYNNDIALIKLAKPIKFSRYILPACIPPPDFAEKVKF